MAGESRDQMVKDRRDQKLFEKTFVCLDATSDFAGISCCGDDPGCTNVENDWLRDRGYTCSSTKSDGINWKHRCRRASFAQSPEPFGTCQITCAREGYPYTTDSTG